MAVAVAEDEARTEGAPATGARRRGRSPGLWEPRPCKVQVTYSERERAELETRAKAAGAESLAQFIRARTVGRGSVAS